MRTVGGMILVLLTVVIVPGVCTATPSLYSSQDLQRELDRAHRSASWQALEGWLSNNGFVKDTGTAIGGTDVDSYGPTANVMETYHHVAATRNAVIMQTAFNDTRGHKQEYYYISESAYTNGTSYYFDWFYDPQTHTVGNTPPGSGGGTLRTNQQIAYNWATCVVAWCAGGAGGCFLGSMASGEITWAPCFIVTCGAAEIACTLTAAAEALRN